MSGSWLYVLRAPAGMTTWKLERLGALRPTADMHLSLTWRDGDLLGVARGLGSFVNGSAIELWTRKGTSLTLRLVLGAMRVKLYSCSIKNFKGIKSLVLDLRRDAMNGIITLVGLNESGKTSILEAIDFFRLGDAGTSAIFNPQFARPTFEEIIPRQSIANFSDTIMISFDIELEEADIAAVADALDTADVTVDRKSFKTAFSIQQVIKYEDSTRKSGTRGWGHEFTAKIEGVDTRVTFGGRNDLWVAAAAAML